MIINNILIPIFKEIFYNMIINNILIPIFKEIFYKYNNYIINCYIYLISL